jgi:hypothetical protein
VSKHGPNSFTVSLVMQNAFFSPVIRLQSELHRPKISNSYRLSLLAILYGIAYCSFQMCVRSELIIGSIFENFVHISINSDRLNQRVLDSAYKKLREGSFLCMQRT